MSQSKEKIYQELIDIWKTQAIDLSMMSKIEFGNDTFDTRQMHPHDFQLTEDEIIVNLIADKTQCKAIDRGETCGTPKQKVKLAEVKAGCCTPEPGCC